ncbi:MAG: efflux RND transporter periplasmic adaptor subunit [Leptolyngbyaceae cyanobacterium SM2_3_12]|nr:efflux RND transporter periplasmic adaptor subunit [Leptolyngbyaceae cyanobacterium SM2_3_12]
MKIVTPDPKPDISPPAFPQPEDDLTETKPDVKGLSDLFDDDEDPKGKFGGGLKWILASGLLLVLAVGGWWGYGLWQRRSADPTTVATATPMRNTLENRVDASGVITLGNQQTLTAPDDITVEEVLVTQGQAVSAGTVLVRLRARDVERSLEEARIEESIQEVSNQRKQELLQEQTRNVRRAQERLAESGQLLDQGFISEDEYNIDRDALESAQSALRTTQVEIQTAELQRQKNQAAIANLEARLSDNSIVAPFDAVVLSIQAQAGDGIPREGELLTLGDPKREVVAFDLATLDASKVSVNMPVRVSLPGPNPQEYPGRVISIAPQAIAGEGSTFSGGGQPTVKAVAELDEPSGVLIPGSSVNLTIILVQEANALAIPLTALQQSPEGPFVWVVDENDRVEQRPVTTGLQTLDAVAITSGLAETDTIVMASPPGESLTEGMEIVPAGAGIPPAGP